MYQSSKFQQKNNIMVRKDHLDLNNIMERHPKRPRRSGGGGVVGDGTTPPFSNSNDIITPITDSFNYSSSTADVNYGGGISSSSSSSSSVHRLYPATASHQRQGRARRWVKALRRPQCMLNEPYFGTSAKANFCVYTWMPVNQLSNEERVQYEEREERINQERMIWWNKNINATTTTTTRCSNSSGSSSSSSMKVDKNDDETEKKTYDEEEEDTKDLTKAAGRPSSAITEEAAVEKIVEGGH
jgi:hypothetical protein